MELLVAGQLFYFDSYCTGASWVMEFLTNYNQGKLKTLSPLSSQSLSLSLFSFLCLVQLLTGKPGLTSRHPNSFYLASSFIKARFESPGDD